MVKKETIKIYISSPKDVTHEVQEMLSSIRKYQDLNKDIELIPFSWAEEHKLASYDLLSSKQVHVNNHLLPSECDLVYIVFGVRFGELKKTDILHKNEGWINPITSTKGKFRSGTEFEFFEAVKGRRDSNNKKPKIILYVIKPDESGRQIFENLKQYNLLTEFLKTGFFQIIEHFDPNGTYSQTDKPLDVDKSFFKQNFYFNLQNDIQEIIKSRIENKKRKKKTEKNKASINPIPFKNYSNYLEKLITDNNTLELTGFGKLSVNPKVNLEQVFVALKADRTQHFEIKQRQEINRILREQERNGFSKLNKTDQQKIDTIDLSLLGLKPISTFYNPQGKGYKFDEVIRNLRWVVILGDPGGGKTTLVRWLTLMMSKAYVEFLSDNEKTNLMVPAKQIDPDNDSDELIDLGKVRMPVLIQIAHYAEWANNKKTKEENNYSLWDYLGQHQGPRGLKFDGFEDSVRKILTEAIEKSEALIILDGIDEIPQKLEHFTRNDIANAIEAFKKNYLEKYNKENRIPDDSPFKYGGNQLIVTSRITGYETAVVSDLMHLIIQPMSDNAVKRFCNLWMHAEYLSRNMLDNIADPMIINAIKKKADGLIEAIYNHHHKNIRELASNPLLLTVIALVFNDYNQNNLKKDKKLPERRVELYQTALEILIHDWRKTAELDTEEIISIMMPLAAYIHSNFPEGYISDKKLKDQLELGIQAEKKNLSSTLLTEGTYKLFKAIEHNTGLLYPRGENLYAFLHLTFQEYLAGLNLFKEGNEQEIIERIYDPRWREPILLAIGYVAWKEKEKIDSLIESILESDKNIDYLVPQGAFIVVAALPSLENIKPTIRKHIIDNLLKSYAKVLNTDFTQIQSKIELCILNLKKNKILLNIIEEQMIIAIGNPRLAASVSVLTERIEFFPDPIVTAIMKNLTYDSKELNWPMQNILMTLANCPIPNYKTPKPVPLLLHDKEFLQKNNPKMLEKLERYFEIQTQLHQHQALINEHSTFTKDKYVPSSIKNISIRRSLENKIELLEKVKGDIELLKILIAFYGGYTYYKRDEIEKEYADIAIFLQKSDAERDQLLEENPEAYLKYAGGYDDVVYSLDVYLDNNMADRNLKEYRDVKPHFNIDGIYKDSSLSNLIYNYIYDDISIDDLKSKLFKICQSGDSNHSLIIDAFIFLILLGEDISNILKLQEQDLLDGIIHNLKSIKKQLLDVVSKSRNAIWQQLKSNLLLNQKGIEILIAFQHIAIDSSSIPVEFSLDIKSTNVLDEIDKNMNFEEIQLINKWIVKLFGGYNDDKIYDAAVLIDTLPSVNQLIKTLHNASLSPNYQKQKEIINWKVISLQPKLSDEDENDIPPEVISNFDSLNLYHIREDLHWAFRESVIKKFREKATDSLELQMVINSYEMTSMLKVIGVTIDYRLNSFSLDTIKDPYYKARCMFHFYSQSGNSISMDEEVVKKIYDTIRKIKSPHKQVRIWELCFSLINQNSLNSILYEIKSQIESIKDIENKARAYGRLALLLPENLSKEWFRLSISTTKLIKENYRKAQTLQELKRVLPNENDLVTDFNEVAETINESWLKAKAYDKIGEELAINPPEEIIKLIEFEKELWAPILLSGVINNKLKELNIEDSLDTLWRKYADSHSKKLFDSILRIGLDANKLLLTLNAAQAINSLLDGKTINEDYKNEVHLILPLLTNVSSLTNPFLALWKNTNDQLLEAHAHLLIIENGSLITVNDILPLVFLIDEGSDLSRLRAYLALASNIWNIHKDRHLTVKIIGRTVIERVAHQLVNARPDEHVKRLALRNFFNNIIHDDNEALIDWATNETPESSVILSEIESITDGAFETFTSLFQLNLSNNIKRSLFISNCKLALCKENHLTDPAVFKTWDKSISFEGIYTGDSMEILADILENLFITDFDNISALIKSAKSNFESTVLCANHITQGSFNFTDIGRNFYRYLDGIDIETIKLADYILDSNKEETVIENRIKFLYYWLINELDSEIQNPEIQGVLIRLLAEISKIAPNSFLVRNQEVSIADLLISKIDEYTSVWVRRGCILLIGSTRKIDDSILTLYLRQAREDRDIWASTIDCINKISFIPSNMLDDILIQLYKELTVNGSAIRAYFASRILVALGKNHNTNTVQKQGILKELTIVSEDILAQRNVYVYRGLGKNNDDVISIHNLITLERAYKQAIVEIIGIS